MKPNEYDLILQNDTNTNGYTQWFFFKVKSNLSGAFRFNLLNFTKSSSMFNYGMRVLASVEQEDGQFAWVRCGSHIEYFQNNFKRDSTGASLYHY